MKNITAVCGIAFLTLVMSGCMVHGGDSKNVTTTTLGEELSDLKVALEEGAISESEYQAIKENLLAARQEHKSHHKH